MHLRFDYLKTRKSWWSIFKYPFWQPLIVPRTSKGTSNGWSWNFFEESRRSGGAGASFVLILRIAFFYNPPFSFSILIGKNFSTCCRFFVHYILSRLWLQSGLVSYNTILFMLAISTGIQRMEAFLLAVHARSGRVELRREGCKLDTVFEIIRVHRLFIM